MSTPRGEFTRKFDREIMGDDSVELEEREVMKALLSAEQEALESEFKKILAVLNQRADWLRKRFKVIEPGDVQFRGRRFDFERGEGSAGAGWLEFRLRLTDTGLGIILECLMGVEGLFKKRYDYIVFPKDAVQVDKAQKFIEAKIFEFAGAWQR